MASSIITLSPAARSHLRRPTAALDTPGSTPLEPSGQGERLESLDMLRGFALFGVLLSNLELVSSQPLAFGLLEAIPGPFQAFDAWATALLRFAVRGKFITLFTLLFGIGFALQIERTNLRGPTALTLFRRRMLWLFLFGATHAVLLWWGDILCFYALVGLALVPLHQLSERRLLGLGATLVAAPAFLLALLGWWLGHSGGTADPATLGAPDGQYMARFEALTSGAPASHLWQQNLVAYGEHHDTVSTAFMMFSILAYFLLGYWLGRQKILQRPGSERGRTNRWFRRIVPFALVGNLALVAAFHPSATGLAAGWRLLLQLLGWFGTPALTLIYLLGLAKLFEKPESRWRERLGWLVPAGRMALTHYLLHSVAFVLLLYHFRLGPIPIGLGWLGRLGSTACWLVALVLFVLQVGFSHWWLGRFHFGPAEWLWRSLTYGRPLPNVRRKEASLVSTA